MGGGAVSVEVVRMTAPDGVVAVKFFVQCIANHCVIGALSVSSNRTSIDIGNSPCKQSKRIQGVLIGSVTMISV